MWIRTQNKQRIINADQIVDIFVAMTQPVIYANTTDDADNLVLGEYKDRDTCLEILEVILVLGSHDDVKWLHLPLGGDAEKWLEDSHRAAEGLYN